MSSIVAVDTTPKWTWADLVSTYRFWALFGFYALASASFFLYSNFLPLLRDSQNLPLSEYGHDTCREDLQRILCTLFRLAGHTVATSGNAVFDGGVPTRRHIAARYPITFDFFRHP